MGSVLSILFPIYAVLAIGAFVRHRGFMSPEAVSGLNRFVFNAALPCMIVSTLARAEPGEGWEGAAAALVLATVAVGVASWVLAPAFGISRFSRPSFCQTVFRSNNAYVGIPVIKMAADAHPAALDGAITVAALVLPVSLLLYNTAAVLLLTRPDASAPPLRRAAKAALGVLRNPLVLGCLGGVAAFLLRTRAGLPPPPWLYNTLRMLGDMATAGALVALGASLTGDRFRASLRGAHAAALLKLGLCPLLGVAACALLGVGGAARFAVLVYLACPSAVASYVMAEAMDGDAELAGSAVAVTNVWSVVSLSAVLLLAVP